MGKCLPSHTLWSEFYSGYLAEKLSSHSEGGGLCCDASWSNKDYVEVGSPLEIALVYPYLTTERASDCKYGSPEME